MDIKIYPLDRVEIDGRAVCFGMERSAVETAIGKGELVGERHYYYNSEMAIDYDPSDKVEFIEFLGGIDGSLKPLIYDVSAFDTNADELIGLLKQKNCCDAVDNENGYSMSFCNISVGVYRDITPNDIAEMIEEMKADGVPADNNEDPEADKRRAEHWATIGSGTAGYYKK